MFSGTSETTFSPNDAMTRAMIVTVLARLDGEDTTSGATWYEIGREWAMKNSISDGSGMMNRLTREQLVAMLWRYAGNPTNESGATWYEIGREWAMKNSISDGSGMMNRLTREQLVAMLWRYAGNPTNEKSLVDFKDAGLVSDYAQEAFSWAVEQGIIHGMTADTLNPKGEATRAQVAAILMRFCENIAK